MAKIAKTEYLTRVFKIGSGGLMVGALDSGTNTLG